jgi:hypothetical protein
MRYMNAPLLQRPRPAALILGAISAAAVAISGILLGADFLNHSASNAVHFVALGVSVLLAGLIGALGRRGAAPWFGWLAYGLMLGSSVLGLGLGAAVLRTGTLPHDVSFRAVLGISLLILVLTIPVVVYSRRQARESGRAS